MTAAGSQPAGRAPGLVSLARLSIFLMMLGVSFSGIAASADLLTADWSTLAGRYVYVISRNGNPIGQQSFDIQADGKAVTATTDTRIVVTFLGLTVYTMNQRIAETYADGELTRLISDTDDDGDVRKVDLTRDGKMLKGTFNGEARSFYCDCMASTMWHADSVAKSVIVEASRARTRRVTTEDKGLEFLDLPIGRMQARHMVVTGELEREVWYDAAGILVASVLKGRDGSTIRQELLQRP